jgi:hypothetical protein
MRKEQTMQNEMNPFLRQGLIDYLDAKHTLGAFEKEMSKRLDEAIAKRNWKPLKKLQISSANPGGESGGYGCWISIYVIGESSRHGSTDIDCGIWWNKEQSTLPILYASFWSKPRETIGFQWKELKQGIQSFKEGSRNRTFLYLPVPKSLELGEPLNRLLDVLLKQLH